MDIELLKTFIEVTRTRHFSRAADKLFLTPAAVSARIRQLEQTLGVTLLYRVRGNIQMTAEGEKLLPYAQQLVQAWQQARQAVADSVEREQRLALGATAGLWQFHLGDLSLRLHAQFPQLVLRTEAYSPGDLVERLLAQQLDMVLVHEAPTEAELNCVKLGQVRWNLVSSKPLESLRQALAGDYVFVDWGPAFDEFHAKRLGDFKGWVYTNQGDMALALLARAPASAYLPVSALQSHSALSSVPGAPTFTRPLYACYRASQAESGLIKAVLGLLTEPSASHSGPTG